jgi:hypothetical protein
MIKKNLIYNFISLIKFDFKLWNQSHNLLVYKLIPMKFRNLIWIELILIGWKNGKVVLCKRAELSRPVSGWPNHFGLVAQLSGIE